MISFNKLIFKTFIVETFNKTSIFSFSTFKQFKSIDISIYNNFILHSKLSLKTEFDSSTFSFLFDSIDFDGVFIINLDDINTLIKVNIDKVKEIDDKVKSITLDTLAIGSLFDSSKAKITNAINEFLPPPPVHHINFDKFSIKIYPNKKMNLY